MSALARYLSNQADGKYRLPYQGKNTLMIHVVSTSKVLIEFVGAPNSTERNFAAVTALLAVSMYGLTDLFDRFGKEDVYDFTNVLAELDNFATKAQPDFSEIYWHKEESKYVQERISMMDPRYVQHRTHAATAVALLEHKRWLFRSALRENGVDSSSMQFLSEATNFILSCMKVNVGDVSKKLYTVSLIGAHLIAVAQIPYCLNYPNGNQEPMLI